LAKLLREWVIIVRKTSLSDMLHGVFAGDYDDNATSEYTQQAEEKEIFPNWAMVSESRRNWNGPDGGRRFKLSQATNAV
jgi:hypothetical protein